MGKTISSVHKLFNELCKDNSTEDSGGTRAVKSSNGGSGVRNSIVKHSDPMFKFFLLVSCISLLLLLYQSGGERIKRWEIDSDIVRTVPIVSGAKEVSTVRDLAEEIFNDWMNRAQHSRQELFPRFGDVYSPSSSEPFVFFHLRKAGGSTLRSALYNASVDLQINNHIPCHGNLDCETYSPPKRVVNQEKAAILAGHFYWPEVYMYGRSYDGPYQINAAGRAPFRCLVQMRKTIGRVKSCWDYRMVQEGVTKNYSQAGDMSADDWKELLPGAMSRFNEGCNNEVARVLSDTGRNEIQINSLNAKQRLFPFVLNETLAHLSQCVVTMLDKCDESRQVIKYYFPWLEPYYNCKVVKNQGIVKDRKELEPDAKKEILRQNVVDDLAYMLGKRLFAEQLHIIQKRQFGSFWHG